MGNLFSCSSSDSSSDNPTVQGLSFEALPLPQTDEEKLSVRVSLRHMLTLAMEPQRSFH